VTVSVRATTTYLDRNQSYGQIELNRTSRFIAKLDYMMKLRAKPYKADTHLMMSKGCSVHVFYFKGRIDDERLEEMRSNDACTSMVQIGDYVMIWIDSLGTNTTHLNSRRIVVRHLRWQL
jgi:hypothetical protein